MHCSGATERLVRKLVNGLKETQVEEHVVEICCCGSLCVAQVNSGQRCGASRDWQSQIHVILARLKWMWRNSLGVLEGQRTLC